MPDPSISQRERQEQRKERERQEVRDETLRDPSSSSGVGGASVAYVDAGDASTLVAAEAYADAKVIDSIVDADATHAPSRNAVFDALAGKEATGVAAGLLAVHVAAADPHPTYLTAAEGNAAYDALGAADAKVIDSIVDADATHAPSRNAVFDALAGKETAGAAAAAQAAAQAFATAADTALLNATISNSDTTHAPTGDAVFDALALKRDTALVNGYLWIGNGSGQSAAVLLSGDVTVSNTGVMTIGAGKVTLAMQANMATASVMYRKTAGAGAPEVQSLATLKTDLGLSGTNSGDQDLSGYAPIASPVFTGNPTGPTPSDGDADTSLATTSFVGRAISNRFPWTQASGAADVIVATFVPALLAYDDGQFVRVRPIYDNATTTPTLNGNGLGAKTIKKNGGDPLAVGDLQAIRDALLVLYDSGVSQWWELLNPASSAGSTPTGTGLYGVTAGAMDAAAVTVGSGLSLAAGVLTATGGSGLSIGLALQLPTIPTFL